MLYYHISAYIQNVSVRVDIEVPTTPSDEYTAHDAIHNLFKRLSVWGGYDKTCDVHVMHGDGSISLHKLKSYEIDHKMWNMIHALLIRGGNRHSMLVGMKEIGYSIDHSSCIEL